MGLLICTKGKENCAAVAVVPHSSGIAGLESSILMEKIREFSVLRAGKWPLFNVILVIVPRSITSQQSIAVKPNSGL